MGRMGRGFGGGGSVSRLRTLSGLRGRTRWAGAVGPSFSALGGSVEYELGDDPFRLDDDAQVHDAELEALNGGDGDWTGAILTVEILSGAGGGEDMFPYSQWSDLVSANGEDEIVTVSDDDVIATFTWGADDPLVITFTGSEATPTTAMVNEVLRSIILENIPAESTYAIRYTLTTPSGTAQGSVSVVVDDPATTGPPPPGPFAGEALVTHDAEALVTHEGEPLICG